MTLSLLDADCLFLAFSNLLPTGTFLYVLADFGFSVGVVGAFFLRLFFFFPFLFPPGTAESC